MKKKMIEKKHKVKAKAMANKDALQLIWRAYQGLILAAIFLMLTAK